MPAIVLNLKSKGQRFEGLGLTYRRVVAEVLKRTATWWHREIFPRHFGTANKGKYQMEQRTQLYLNKIKREKGVGQGKFVYEVLTGQSERWMRHLVSITGTSRRVNVRMKVPAYFDRPFVGSFTDPKTGRRKHIRRQPDKPAEVERVDREDGREIREYAQRRLDDMMTLNLRLLGAP